MLLHFLVSRQNTINPFRLTESYIYKKKFFFFILEKDFTTFITETFYYTTIKENVN